MEPDAANTNPTEPAAIPSLETIIPNITAPELAATPETPAADSFSIPVTVSQTPTAPAIPDIMPPAPEVTPLSTSMPEVTTPEAAVPELTPLAPAVTAHEAFSPSTGTNPLNPGATDPAAAPAIVTSGDYTVDANPTPMVTPVDSLPIPTPPKGRSKKPVLLSLAAAVVIIGGAAAYYFGYYMSPSVVYSQALGNSGKGYDKLSDYINQQAALNYKGITATGNYTLGSGSFATDGNLSFNTDGSNADATADVNIGSSRLGFDFRTIKGTSANPDIYFKASGLSGLQSYVAGTPYGPLLTKYDNQWIVVDQSLITSLEKLGGGTSSLSMSGTEPTNEQAMDEVNAFGKVNDQYVFTGNKSKSIFTVVKNDGKQTIDGHKTYHYMVALNKDNVKSYITAQRDALKASKLYSWIKQSNYANDVDLGYDSLEQSANNIKSTKTFDIWVDSSQRIIYKVRVSDDTDPADNYVELGLNYKGGSNYPFFVNINSKQDGDTTTGSFTDTLNTSSHVQSLGFTLNGSGADSFNFKSSLSLQATNNVTPITAPTDAKPLTQVFNDLGIGSIVNDLLSGGDLQTSPSDTSSTDSTFFQ